tara:strand:+ start:1423 stop:2115 length:693 start_codon:yes stop_codon:yes gene_type:complete
MNILCVIPARGGSKGVERKNLRILNKKPLIAYTIESCISSKLFDDVIVSSEDPEIIKVSKKFGAKVPFVRPKNLANDNSSSDDVLLHAISEMRKLGSEYDIIVLRDCTVPFIDKDDMRGMLRVLNKSRCDAVFGAIKAHPNPYFGMMEFDKNGFLISSKKTKRIIIRRQEAPIVFDVDGMFALKIKNFEKTKKINSGKILPFELSKEHGHMIDFEFDFKVAELLSKSKKK